MNSQIAQRECGYVEAHANRNKSNNKSGVENMEDVPTLLASQSAQHSAALVALGQPPQQSPPMSTRIGIPREISESTNSRRRAGIGVGERRVQKCFCE